MEGLNQVVTQDMIRSVLRPIRDVFLTGLAIIVPLALTFYVIWFVITGLRSVLLPVVRLLENLEIIDFFRSGELIRFLLEAGVYGDVYSFLSEAIAVLLFLILVMSIGAFARYRYGEFLVDVFDYLIGSIPGIGTVYQTFRRVGTMVVGERTSEFEAVKLVELLSEETYVIAFQTNPSPDPVTEATGEDDMMTLFVPMAPNPVTGGFLVYVPTDRVVDVDLSMEEAIQAILTSGIGTDDPDAPNAGRPTTTWDRDIIDRIGGAKPSDGSDDGATE